MQSTAKTGHRATGGARGAGWLIAAIIAAIIARTVGVILLMHDETHLGGIVALGFAVAIGVPAIAVAGRAAARVVAEMRADHEVLGQRLEAAHVEAFRFGIAQGAKVGDDRARIH